MKRLLTIFILCVSLQYLCYSQKQGQEKIDSLFSILSGVKEDTTKVNTLNALVLEFRYTNPDTAIYFAYKALELATKLNYEMGIADSKLRVGMLCANLGKYDEGVQSCNDALVLYNKLILSATKSNKEIILAKIARTYNVIGHNRLSQGNYPEALKYSFLALKIREEIGDKKGIADTEGNIGNIYVIQHNYAEAMKHFSVTLKISLQLGNKADLSAIYGNIGGIYHNQGNYAEALKNYSAALKLSEEAKDNLTTGSIYLNFGDINERQENYNEALKYYFAALKIFEENGNNEHSPLSYLSIASVYTKQKKYNTASEYLDQALSLSKKIGNLQFIKYSYENWAALDSAQGNYKKALEHYKLAIAYRDSLFNEANTKKMVQQQMQYDFDKKESLTKAEQEKKDAIAEKKLQKQKLVRNGFVSGFAVVLLFAGVFFTQRNRIKKGKKLSDELLLNILPSEVAEELKAKGSAEAKQFDDVTVMFTDFKDFTQISEKLSPAELVAEIDYCFKAFDAIITRHNIEKIKTIGDSYMCAGGLPVANKTNATDVVSAAIEIQQFVLKYFEQRIKNGKEPFEIRIGIHTGPVVAGIVGVKKFAYDIWGDTVNIASRMESSGEAGKVNISGSTYELVKDKFNCTYRGKITAKNKGEIDMYFVERT